MAARDRRKLSPLVWLALLIGLSAPLLVLVGAVGTKSGFWDWHVGFVQMTVQWATKAAMAGVVAGVVALILAFLIKRRAIWIAALVALVVPAATLAGFARFKAQAQSVPPIHDVSTNWSDPPQFSARMMSLRGAEANPVEPDPRVPEGPRAGAWAGRRVAEINAETCPGAKPVLKALDADRVRAVLDDMDLQILGAAPWRVEATAESGWFGFMDDVIVRIQPERTDVRSVSRVGGSDIGANCERVTEIVRRLNESSATRG